MFGYGRFHNKYETGREGDWMNIGAANTKQYISLYRCAADDRGQQQAGFLVSGSRCLS